MRVSLALLALTVHILLTAFGGGEANAQQQQTLDNGENPVLLRADELIFDDSLNVVTATGNVELTQGDRVLMADTLSFNRASSVATASGNVVLLERQLVK